jgi:HSP20 family protein
MKNKDKDKDKDVAKATPTSSPLGTGLIAFDDLDRWFDNLLSCRWLQSDWKFPNWPEREFALSRNLPKVDIIGHDNEIKVQAALSGVKKEDLDVSINKQTVTIRASSKQEEETKNADYYCREISRGEFQRTLSLPIHMDGEKAKASFKDGILDITIPKSEQSKRRSIEIM